LTDARKLVEKAIDSKDPKAIDTAQTFLTKTMSSFRVIVESNPQLQAAPLVKDLMNELRDTSDKVMYSRRTLIDLSADFNIKIATFPGNLFATLFGFTPQKGLNTPVSGEFLSVSESETANPTVKL
jgi:LemA protein